MAFEQEGPAVTWASSLSTGPFSSQKRPASGTDGKSQENSYLRKRSDLIVINTLPLGDMMMTTTNNDTYKMIRGDHRAERIVKKPTLNVSKKLGKFETQTQNRRDFPLHPGARPAQLAEPAPETIDLRFDNKYEPLKSRVHASKKKFLYYYSARIFHKANDCVPF